MADRAAGAGHRAGGGGGGGGQNPGAAHPHGPQEKRLYKEKSLPKNENRVVLEEKVIYTGTPFKSEYTLTKINNKELQKTYDEMHVQHGVITRASSIEVASDGLNEYNKLMEKVKLLREEIKKEKGLAIPLPTNLKKLPKPKSKIY